MKELHKRLLALGMGAVMIFAMGAAGCNSGNQGQTTQTPSTGTTTPDPDKDKDKGEPSVTPDPDKEQDDPTQTPAKTKEEAISAFNAAVQKINADKNFTYTEIGAEYVAEFEGAKLKVTENGASVFYVTEDDQNYSYTLRDSEWHKDFSETTAAEIFSSLTAVLSDVVWSDFEAEENLLTGTASGETIEATVTETALTVETAQKKFTLTKLGTTAVSLPADAVDDTDASNFIFTTDENGETVWNVKAIKDVLEPWLKNEGEGNQYGKDMFASSSKNGTAFTREVLYINPSKDKIAFGLILDIDGQIGIIESYFYDSAFYASLKNKETMTRKEFKDYLMQINQRRIGTSIKYIEVEYTTLDEDYETAHKQEFETLTKNVFEKYHKEKNAADPDYTGAKIFFAFKIPMGPINGHGDGRQWAQYYLIEQAGKLEIIEFQPRGLLAGLGCLQNVLQNVEGRWTLEFGLQHIAEVSSENLVLFDAPIMTIGKIA